jgi:hypothetical protein
VISPLLVALSLAALPEGAARYRAELGGEPVGTAELRIACAGAACAATYESRLRAPAEAGGAVARTRIEVEVDRAGLFRGGPLRVVRGDASGRPDGVAGAVPASLVEVVLGSSERPSSCVRFFREGRASAALACGRREGGAILADVDGIAARIVPGEDGFPAEVRVEGSFRFLRDGGAEVPARAPRVAGTRVPGPADPRRAGRFCGVEPDAAAAAPPPGAALPAPRAPGESCREKAAAWLAAARALGFDGRSAVGVAWDGARFVWHAWAEVRAGGAWIPVDPSFGQLPAAGPRFTLARWADGDDRAHEAAGARILACWGSARVEDLPSR